MDYKKIIVLLAVGCMTLGAVSCKKEDEDEVKSYLSGALNFEVPSFVSAGDVITLTPKGAKHPEGKPLGYYWQIQELGIIDTVKFETDPETVSTSFKFAVPDTLISFTIKCAAFAKGYYELYNTKIATAIHPEKSVRGYDWSKAAGFFEDKRDHKLYPFTTIDTLDWFCKNLAFEGLGVSYDYSKSTADALGNYYTWDEAVAACPEGWRLSSENDWLDLARQYKEDGNFKKYSSFEGVAGNVMGDMRFNEENTQLWEFWPDVKITNDNYLCILPFGYGSSGNFKDFTFTGFRKFAAFWTADSYDKEQAVLRYFYEDQNIIYASTGFKSDFRAPVRCVRKTLKQD